MIDTVTLKVFGMTCNGCVSGVKNALNDTKGVQKVDVSLDQEQAVIEFDDEQVDVATLVGVIEDAGFSTT